jgi:hypothetical protein
LAAIRTCEQSIFPVECDGAFDGVVVDFDSTIVDEARQAFPARQGVADGFGELALLADQAKLSPQPWFESIERLTFLLPDGAAFVGAADVLLDGVKRRDMFERFARDRRRTGVASS